MPDGSVLFVFREVNGEKYRKIIPTGMDPGLALVETLAVVGQELSEMAPNPEFAARIIKATAELGSVFSEVVEHVKKRDAQRLLTDGSIINDIPSDA